MKKCICRLMAMVLVVGSLFTQTPVAAETTAYSSSAEEVLATSSNAKEIYHFLVYNMGLNSAAACGILANLRRESYFNPDRLGDAGTSYGICQWHDTSTGVGRYTNLINWCTQNGYDYTQLEGQLQFLYHELSQNDSTILHNGKTILDYMRTIENSPEGAYTAGYYWCDTFEVPFSNNPDKRAAECDARGTLARDIYWPAYCEPTLDGTQIVAGGIQVNWEAFTGASQYELYRYANGDPSTITLVAVTTDTYAIDTTVASGNNYTYMMCAVIQQADGTTYTANAKELTQYYLAPTEISTIVGHSTYQKVKWSKVNGATKYIVYRSDDGNEYVEIGSTDKASFKDTTALTSDVRYSYQVYACHEEEGKDPLISLASNAMGNYTLSQPQITSIANVSSGIRIKWDKVPKAKFYSIYRSINGKAYEEIASVTKKSYTDTDIDASGTVKYKIYAHFTGTKGQTSISKVSKTVSISYLGAPKLSSVATSGGSMTPKWTQNKNATGYEIQYCKSKSFKSNVTTLLIVTNDTTSWRIKNLKKGQSYYVRVRSYVTKNGKRSYSAYSAVKKCTVK